jgi:hypothetical protein
MKPEFVVPSSVAVDLVLLRTDEVAVTIGLVRAFPSGFEFTVDSRARRAGQGGRIGGFPRRYLPDVETEDGLRLGLEFSDGRRAEVNAPYPFPDRFDPDALIVTSEGGGGSDRSWHSRFWVYPLPTPGPLSFVATWPAFDVAEVRVDLEADMILSAATRALVLWPEAPGLPSSGSTLGVVTAGSTEHGGDQPA